MNQIKVLDNRKLSYAIFPRDKHAATGLIDFQDGVMEPNGCTVEDLMRVAILRLQDLAKVNRYGAIAELQKTLEYLKREKS